MHTAHRPSCEEGGEEDDEQQTAAGHATSPPLARDRYLNGLVRVGPAACASCAEGSGRDEANAWSSSNRTLAPPWPRSRCVLTSSTCLVDYADSLRAGLRPASQGRDEQGQALVLAPPGRRRRGHPQHPGASSPCTPPGDLADPSEDPQSDSRLISTLYRYHKKASAANKLTSLYLVDGIAREARSRQKKLDKEAKGKGREGGAAQSPSAPAAGSTTPTKSPPPSASPAPAASAGLGTYASFLKLLEGGMLAKFVLDNWENGLPEHRVRLPPTSLCRPPRAARKLTSALCSHRKRSARSSTSGPRPRRSARRRWRASARSSSRRARPRQSRLGSLPLLGLLSVQVRFLLSRRLGRLGGGLGCSPSTYDARTVGVASAGRPALRAAAAAAPKGQRLVGL